MTELQNLTSIKISSDIFMMHDKYITTLGFRICPQNYEINQRKLFWTVLGEVKEPYKL